jgi:hypothetical protein
MAGRKPIRSMAMAMAAASVIMPAVAAPGGNPPTGLRDVPGITEGLVVVDLGNIIRKGCERIEARRVAGLLFMLDLKERASSAGFTDAEIRSFVEDPAEKARIRARADRWLADHGARRDRPETLCAVGAAEIAAKTQLGRLLRMD